ncbi:hypothetical protein BJ741DRAFT_604593 [Chytriomyces cf. hyalinus JEL632]|nr:hypothetical protein BJ741DRAFT_604593 [Chytriomyces cf. hyalinus JEL632]
MRPDPANSFGSLPNSRKGVSRATSLCQAITDSELQSAANLEAMDARFDESSTSTLQIDLMLKFLEGIAAQQPSELYNAENSPGSAQIILEISNQLRKQEHEHQLSLELQREVSELKEMVGHEHGLRISAALETVRLEEQLAEYASANTDKKDSNRSRTEKLRVAHLKMDSVLSMTPQEIRDIAGQEILSLCMAIQHHHKQLVNFTEILKHVQNSHARQLSEYADIIQELKNDKIAMSQKFAGDLSELRSAANSNAIHEIAKSVSCQLEKDHANSALQAQKLHTANHNATQNAVHVLQSEKTNLLELLEQQRSGLDAMHNRVIQLEAQLATNTTHNHSTSALELDGVELEQRKDSLEVNRHVMDFVLKGKRVSSNVHKMIQQHEVRMSALSLRASSFSIDNSVLPTIKMSAKLLPLSDNSDEGSSSGSFQSANEAAPTRVKNLLLPSNFQERNGTIDDLSCSTSRETVQKVSPDQTGALIAVLKDENAALLLDLSRNAGALLQANVLIENLETAAREAKLALEQFKESSTSHVSDALSEEVKELSLDRDKLHGELCRTQEELLTSSFQIIDKEADLARAVEELLFIKNLLPEKQLGKLEREFDAVAARSKLVQSSLELGAQLSKLNTEFASNLWELKDLKLERDQLQQQYNALGLRFRETKQKLLNSQASAVTHRVWGTQTDEVSSLASKLAGSSSTEEQIAETALQMKAQQKLIRILQEELSNLQQTNKASSHDSQVLRMELVGLRRQSEEMHSNVDGFLNKGSEKLSDESPTTIKIALYEARKQNAQLVAKLTSAEKSVQSQKETIFTIGSQLAQQSLKLGEAEWDLRQKEDQRLSAQRRLEALELEKKEISEKLMDARRDLEIFRRSSRGSCIPLPADLNPESSLNESKAAYDDALAQGSTELVSTIKQLDAMKSETSLQLDAANHEVDGINDSIAALTQETEKAEFEITSTAKKMALKSEESEWSNRLIESLSAKIESLEAKAEEQQKFIASLQKSLQDSGKHGDFMIVEVIKADQSEGAPSISGCRNCESSEHQILSLMNQLDSEIFKTKQSIQARFDAEQGKTSLTMEVVQLQKRLDEAQEELEFTKAQTERQLKSYKEMKNLILSENDMHRHFSTTPTITVDSETCLPSMVVSQYSSLDKTKTASSEMLADHIQRATNVQLQLEASTRENSNLKETIRKLELRLAVSRDELREVKAAVEREDNLQLAKTKERVELSEAVNRLQHELSDQMLAKGSLEAELLRRDAEDKKSFFKKYPLKIPSMRKSRNNSVSSNDQISPSSAASPLSPAANYPGADLENRIIEERNSMAEQLAEKAKENAGLTLELSNLRQETAKLKREKTVLNDRMSSLIQDHEGELQGMRLAHSDIEEYLQTQVRELTDQLYEPQPVVGVTKQKGKTEIGSSDEVTSQALKTEQNNLRKAQTSLREAHLTVNQLKLNVDDLEQQMLAVKTRHGIEARVSAQIIDAAQKMLEDLSASFKKKQIEAISLAEQLRMRQADMLELTARLEEQEQTAKQLAMKLDNKFKAGPKATSDQEISSTALSEQAKSTAQIHDTHTDSETRSASLASQISENKNLKKMNEEVELFEKYQQEASAAEAKMSSLEAKLSALEADLPSQECSKCELSRNELHEWQDRYEMALSELTDVEWQRESIETKAKILEAKLLQFEGAAFATAPMQPVILLDDEKLPSEEAIELQRKTAELQELQYQFEETRTALAQSKLKVETLELKLTASTWEVEQLRKSAKSGEPKEQTAAKNLPTQPMILLDDEVLPSEESVQLKRKAEELLELQNHFKESQLALAQAKHKVETLELKLTASSWEVEQFRKSAKAKAQMEHELEEKSKLESLVAVQESMISHLQREVQSATKAVEVILAEVVSNTGSTEFEQLSAQSVASALPGGEASLPTKLDSLTSQIRQLLENLKNDTGATTAQISSAPDTNSLLPLNTIVQPLQTPRSSIASSGSYESAKGKDPVTNDSTRLESLRSEYNVLVKEKLKAENELKAKITAITYLKNELDSLLSEDADLKETISSQASTIRAKDVQISKREEELKQLRLQATNLQTHSTSPLESQIQPKANVKSNLDSLLESKEAEVLSLTESVASRISNVADLESMIEKLKARNERLEVKLKSLDSSEKTELVKMKDDQIADLEVSVATENSARKARDARIRGLEEGVQRIEAELLDAKIQLEVKTIEVEESRALTTIQESSLREKETQVLSLRAEIGICESKLFSSEKLVQKQNQDLQSLLSTVETLQTTVRELESHIVELKEQVLTREEEVLEVRTWLNESEEDLAHRERQVIELLSGTAEGNDRHAGVSGLGLGAATADREGRIDPASEGNTPPAVKYLSPISAVSPATVVNEHGFKEDLNSSYPELMVVPTGLKLVERSVHEYLFRIYWQHLAVVFVILLPLSVCNMASIEIPYCWRILAQLTGGICAIGLLSRPRTSLQHLKK